MGGSTNSNLGSIRLPKGDVQANKKRGSRGTLKYCDYSEQPVFVALGSVLRSNFQCHLKPIWSPI
jgi:hypothetical protein